MQKTETDRNGGNQAEEDRWIIKVKRSSKSKRDESWKREQFANRLSPTAESIRQSRGADETRVRRDNRQMD